MMGHMGWRLGRRPGLDGLRGVAILLVLACHGFSTTSWFRTAGSVGVTLFFTLSGFLITDILLGGITLGRFYRNRALRLFPALGVVLAVCGSIEVAAHFTTPLALLPVVFYSANWAAVFGANNELMRHTWSLAVEEQFYLVWPFVLLAARRWRRGPEVAVTSLAVVSLAMVPAHWHDYQWLNDGTDVRAFGLLVGAGLAIAARRGLPALTAHWAPVLGLGALLAFAVCWVSVQDVAYRIVPVAVPLVAAALIWTACWAPGRMLTSAPLRYFGERSYGIYLWNFPFIVLAQEVFGFTLGVSLIALALSIGAAELSWRLVERPFLAMKSHGSSRDERGSYAAAACAARRASASADPK